MSENRKRLMVLTVALPEFYAEDLTQEHADEYWNGDMSEAAWEGLDFLISPTCRLLVAQGDETGNNTLFNLNAQVVAATVTDFDEYQLEPEDERLTQMLEDEGWERESYLAMKQRVLAAEQECERLRPTSKAAQALVRRVEEIDHAHGGDAAEYLDGWSDVVRIARLFVALQPSGEGE